MRESPKVNPGRQPCKENEEENPKENSGRQPCRENKDERKP
jgi:hypothetical protein